MKTVTMLHAPTGRGVANDNFKVLADATDDLIWSVDRNFKLKSSNRAFKEKSMKLATGAIDKASAVLSIELRFITFYERALSGMSFIETEYSKNPELWLEISFFPIRKEKDVLGVACYCRDVTLSKQEEHRLKLMESVVTNATDSILITEVNSSGKRGPTIVYANDALLKMTGYTRGEIIGKTPQMLHGPKSNKAELALALKCLAESTACEIDIVKYKKNGDEFYMHIAIAPIANGKVPSTHYISIGRDITERTKNIEAIKEQNKKLKDIAWVQSHDVRGPLARIKGLVNLLTNHTHSEDDTELLGYLRSASNEMDAVVSKITRQTDEVPGFISHDEPLHSSDTRSSG